jgi:thiamine-monophosphate kinase
VGELAFIERIRARAARSGGAVALGIGDDCAILRPPPGHEVLVTTDFSLEGRHFRRDWHSARSVGHRTLARGLSDLAAMGARPLAAFLSLALPREMLTEPAGRRWVNQFLDGLLALAAEFRVPLAGGDTSESPSGLVLADIVLVGSAPAGRALRRSGARPGDLLYVTGTLGGAAAQLARLTQTGRKLRAQSIPPHNPMPRVRVGMELLRRKLAVAAIDLSDGLSTDLSHLCTESRVGAELWERALPVSSSASITQALHGGEDYELLFAARPSTKIPHSIAGVAITPIGVLLPGRGMRLPDRGMRFIDAQGKPRLLKPAGWEHFRAPNQSSRPGSR